MILLMLIWLQSQADAEFLLNILRYFSWAIVEGQANSSWLYTMPADLKDHVYEVGKAIVDALF